MPYEIVLIDSIPSLMELAPAWRQCFQKTLRPSPFLSWSWVTSWMEFFGQDLHFKPCVVCVVKDGEVIGILPLRVRSQKIFSTVQVPTLEFLPSCTQTCPDMFGFLGSPEVFEQNLAAILEVLKRDVAWELMDLKEFSSNFNHHQIFFQHLASAFPGQALWSEAYGHIPVLELPATWEEYLKSFKQKKRYNIKAALKHAEEELQCSFTCVLEAEKILQHLPAFFDLCEKPLARSANSFCSARSRSFHLDLLRKSPSDCYPQLFLVKSHDQIVAGLYGFLVQDTFYYYQLGRRNEPQWSGLGQYVLAKTLMYCMEHKVKVFNFLRGDEAYKHHWTTATIHDHRILLARAKLLPKIVVKGWQARRKLLQTFREG